MKIENHSRWLRFILLSTGLLLGLFLVGHLNPTTPDLSEVPPKAITEPPAPVLTTSVSAPAPPQPAFTPPISLSGDAARQELCKSGQWNSLNVALTQARHAIEKLDPNAPDSHNASHFANNPGQLFNAWFSPDGIEIAGGLPESIERPWSMKFGMTGSGREATMVSESAAAISSAGSRVEIKHSVSGITEWYENSPNGIEQGFILQDTPQGDGGSVFIVLSATGSLRAQMTSAREIVFQDDSGQPKLTCSGLHAWDASGRALSSELILNGNEIRMTVDDREAIYPVVIDPLFASAEARLNPDPPISTSFGYSLAIDGDTAVVGDPFLNTASERMAGGAYVFVRNGGLWQEQARLTVSNAGSYELFGSAVAIDGNTIMLGGANRDNAPTTAGAEAVAAFVRSGTIWTEQQVFWETPLAPEDNLFGASISIDGDTAVIGAPGGYTYPFTSGFTLPGSAYVFVRTGNAWLQQAKLNSADIGPLDQYGYSVAISGNTVLVGAYLADTPAGTDAGSAYVWTRSGTTWTEQAKLMASNAAPSGGFGFSVALDGNTAAIGACVGDYNTAGTCNAYVFQRTGTTWSLQQRLFPADGTANDKYGYSVSLSNGTLVIGAKYGDSPMGQRYGKAYVYLRTGSAWAEQRILFSPSGARWDGFGQCVSISGDTAIISSNIGGSYSLSKGNGRENAQVFDRSGTTWTSVTSIGATYNPEYGRLGNSLAISGNTIIVGSPGETTAAGQGTGCAYIFNRDGTTWRSNTKLTAPDAATNAYFGCSVDIDGDIAVVGARWATAAGRSYAGTVHTFYRTGADWSHGSTLAETGTTTASAFGDKVALSGDTLIVSSWENTYAYTGNGITWAPAATLHNIHGNPVLGPLAIEGDTCLVGTQVLSRSGSAWFPQDILQLPEDDTADSVALSGNTAVVGSASADSSIAAISGAAYVFVRDTFGWHQEAKLTATDSELWYYFGSSVAISGDTALIGAYGDSVGPTSMIDTVGTRAGSAYVFKREGSIWTEQLKLTGGVDSSSNDNFGWSVALAGDLAVIGSDGESMYGQDAGSAYVYFLGELPSILSQPVSRTTLPGNYFYFSIWATGYGPLKYQWRKDGANIPGANDSYYFGGPTSPADQGNYDCIVSNIGGVITSAPATLKVNILSQFAPVFPTAAPTDSLFVNLTPPGVGAWRFTGEQSWRASGNVGGLPAGIRTIEFMPVGGYLQPASVTKTIPGDGSATFVTANYATGPSGTGSLKVVLAADGLPAKWRIFKPGTKNEPWRSSGFLLSDLPIGTCYVEFKPVTNHLTPAPVPVVIEKGPTSFLSISYPARESPVGVLPKVVPFETVGASEDRPFAFVGQIRSDLGFSSGFVVKSRNSVAAGGTVSRVVATAGHVVFDDSTKSFVGGLQWLLQRDRDAHEPEPLIPRGAHLMDDYAAARVGSAPGIGNETSQNRDAAVLFFGKDAGRGGYCGILASDDPNNEFLLTTPPESTTLKMLVGYPVEGDDFIPGRMYASPPTAATFSRVSPTDDTFHTFRTTDISGSGGMSGGPLCVQFENGGYLPAAIYLGGSGEAIVRAIDGQVIDLIERAEASSAAGDNQTGGGFTLLSFSNIAGGSSANGAVHVVIYPKSASANAYWRVNEREYHQSDTEETLPAEGAPYTLYMTPVEGFETPDPAGLPLEFKGGKIQEITYTYVGAPEIAIEHAGTSLTDGVSTSDFGSVAVKTVSPGRTFSIRNRGHADLTGLAITMGGANAADFTITQPAKTRLSPGAKTTFKVIFKPSAKGSRKATIRIASNDEDESQFDIKITGKGTAAAGKANFMAAFLPRVHPESSDSPNGNQRQTFTSVETSAGRKYLALTVAKQPGDFYTQRDIEVSPNLMDWFSGPRHTTLMMENSLYLKVRDNRPFTTKDKRFIRLKEGGKR